MGPEAKLSLIARVLATRGIDHAVVVDEDGVVLGVVSTKDLARVLVQAFEEAGTVEALDLNSVLQTQALEVASRPPIIHRGRGPLSECAERLVHRDIGILPFVDDSGRLVGACTELDFAVELVGSSAAARSYASSPVVMGEAGDSVIELLGYMLEKGFRRVPLRHEGELYMATMATLLLHVVRMGRRQALLDGALAASAPAPRLGIGATVGEAAELILSSTERAVLLLEDGDPAAIITERDMVRAYLGTAH